MTPEELDRIRAATREVPNGSKELHLTGLIWALLEYIDQQDETIAALRAGQGTYTGDTR